LCNASKEQEKEELRRRAREVKEPKLNQQEPAASSGMVNNAILPVSSTNNSQLLEPADVQMSDTKKSCITHSMLNGRRYQRVSEIY